MEQRLILKIGDNMRRNPLYVFKDASSTGLDKVPLESMIQIINSDGLGTPKTLQVKSKSGITGSTTIEEFLENSSNYIDQIENNEIPSELQKREINGNVGWRMLGREDSAFGDIGQDAIDFSNASSTGISYSVGALGSDAVASGVNTLAYGRISTTMGWGTIARGTSSVALGQFNVGASFDNLLEVGIGQSEYQRKNALEVHSSGRVSIPGADLSLIDTDATGKTVTTKEYVDRQDNLKLDKIGGVISQDLDIGNDLEVRGNTTLNGSLIVANIDSSVEFSQD